MATTLQPTDMALPRERTPGRVASILNSYLFRKLLKALLTAFVVITLTFFLIRLLPSNPIELFIQDLMVQYSMPYHQARDQAAALFAIDLDRPLILQYLDYLAGLLRGNLGTSILSPGTPVSSYIQRFLPWTIFSVGLALMISFSLGVLLGLVMAYRRDSWLDHGLSVLASVLSAIPNYILGILLIIWLGVRWGLVPVAQMRGSLSPGVQPGLTFEFFADALYHAAMPIAAYVLSTVGSWMLTMKSSTISVLGEDYVTVARAKGLPESRITTAYVGRNAALPLFTLLAISIGFVVGGSVLIETLFQYQGVGYILLQAVNKRDYTIMQGVFLIITLSVIFANFFADILYSWLDPRIKLGAERTR
ncbi:MAG TPA: ABC transporter permease [Caldilineaceae bacterium]|nr:ABC transporter permease [Caldilineaceae bacterium]